MVVSKVGMVVGIAVGELVGELIGLGVGLEVVKRQVGIMMGESNGFEVG